MCSGMAEVAKSSVENKPTECVGDIAIVRNSEILPSDGDGARLWRSGLLAKHYIDRGRSTRWIVASFDHYHKAQRDLKKLAENPDLKGLVVLKTPNYRKNISFSRFKEHLIFGVKLYQHFRNNPKPAAIVCSWPTPESSFFSVLYGKKYDVPVILDVRDKWPDVLFEGQPKLKKLFFQVATIPYKLMLLYSMRNADAIVGVNPDFLAWGQKYGRSFGGKFDFVSHIPFKIPETLDKHRNEAQAILEKSKAEQADLLITFAGTLGLQVVNFAPFHKAIELAKIEGRQVKFLICGDGSNYEALKAEFSETQEVYFAGRIDSSTVFELLKQSDVLLACYQDFDNFRNHLTNKFMEYLAAGRPMVSSMQGLAKTILADNQAGKTYATGEELWQALSYYIEDRSRLEQESDNAKKLYESHFNPDSIMMAFEEKVDEIIRRYSR